jgi:hypothetical protein
MSAIVANDVTSAVMNKDGFVEVNVEAHVHASGCRNGLVLFNLSRIFGSIVPSIPQIPASSRISHLPI